MSVIKFHKNLVLAVVDIVYDCMIQGAYADKVIERVLKSDKRWGSRDRSFIAETAYDVIRHFRLLFEIANTEGWEQKGDGGIQRTDEQITDHISTIKDYRSLIVKLIGNYFILFKKTDLPDWDLFSDISQKSVMAAYDVLKNNFAIFHSYPDELVELVRAELPETYQQELIALNGIAPLVLRCNTIVCSPVKLKLELANLGITVNEIEGIPGALLADKKFNVFKDPLFQKGWYEIQDASSQCVAPFLKVEPGQRVIDACAGAGGKSLHLAALMQNKGRIISLDTEEWKLSELKRRASRNKIHIIETRTIENNKVIKRLHESCDRLLLDVPCSGLGVLKRNPDAKWKINREYILRMIHLQSELLKSYSSMLKPGGLMVYATCSILPSENAKQIAYFCSEHHHFQLEEEKIISPAVSGFDGFYMARLKKS